MEDIFCSACVNCQYSLFYMLLFYKTLYFNQLLPMSVAADVSSRVISGVYDCVYVCVCVRTLKRKRLKLSTPNLIDIQYKSVAQH